METKTKTLSASEFKTRCLKILDELEPQGIIITKRGQPIAKVLPMRRVQFQELYGSMKGKIKVKGDIFSTGIKWNAESGRC
ncbi:MAG TPA: type II toxin-antitoxin system prevent-host-death family antitoxin [Terriglobia bacterium]|nr:type II toxin-antitoxin system prevent-host-death family antitoxin [Terriglobia bacterium]